MIERATIFGPKRTHRYSLWRIWSEQFDMLQRSEPRPQIPLGVYVNFICLNPSTATETEDDPTITRLIDFAKQWGYSSLCVTNLFAYRSTDPSHLKTALEPIGEENNRWILDIAKEAHLVICAWGNHGLLFKRAAVVVKMLKEHGVALQCFKISDKGQPYHPLYLRADLKPIPFERRKAAA